MIFRNSYIGTAGTALWPYSLQLDSAIPPDPETDMDRKTSYAADLIRYETTAGSTPATETGQELDIQTLLNQRGQVIEARVEMILDEIEKRRMIKDRNLSQITRDQCIQRNAILTRGDQVWDKYRVKFEQDILRLETERRKELSSYFKDLLFLRKELRDSLIEKMEEDQKAALLPS